ncbi:MAG: KEOPS complex kinase/ATPase Bud32 [archaeon]
MEMIYKGAEAELWRTTYLGIDAVEKRRVPKTYRIKEIDERIRRARVKKEALMLIEARRAVKTPYILDVNDKKMSITMEHISGEKVRDAFYKGKKIRETSEKIGEAVRSLHDAGLIHGDLTTSNIIDAGGELYFIDFGLAYNSHSLEDKAVDVLVLKKMLKSTHWRYFDEIWGAFKKAYADGEVLKKTEEIEKRARYAEH